MPEKKENEAPISLTKQDLADLISTAVTAAVAAAKQPNVIEQQKLDAQTLDIQAKQKMRESLAESVRDDIERKKQEQRTCSHEHRTGQSHCVHISEPMGYGYLLCQKNQCKIRPGTPPHGYKGNDIYDTALYNRIIQKTADNELFG